VLREARSVERFRVFKEAIEGYRLWCANSRVWTVNLAVLAAATTPDAQGFVDLTVKISRIVRINDMFPEYIHRPLTARLRRNASLAMVVADFVPALSGGQVGVGNDARDSAVGLR
jgi:hypothetical protein